jgi:hypothetical protein
LLGFVKPHKNQTKKCVKLKHFVFLEMTVNRVGEKAENQAKSGKKPSVEKTKSFVWINARKKPTVNRLSGKKLHTEPVFMNY